MLKKIESILKAMEVESKRQNEEFQKRHDDFIKKLAEVVTE